MAAPINWYIICEGKSEIAYLSHLARFLRGLAQARGLFFPPLTFTGIPPVHGVGGGGYPKVNQVFRAERKANWRGHLKIWLDADVYVREKNEAPDTFAKRTLVTKGYCSFSALVFEDFLAMHFDDGLYEEWKRAFARRGHFAKPLVKAEHDPLFLPFWGRAIGNPDARYKKGDLPEDWITVASLTNLFRHCVDPDILFPVRALTPAPTFPEFLHDQFLRAQLLPPPSGNDPMATNN